MLSDNPLHTNRPTESAGSPSRHHRWMVAGCATVVVLAIALVIGGMASSPLLIGAFACMTMMGVMMWLMSRPMRGHIDRTDREYTPRG